MFINYSKAAKTREIIMAHIKQSELPVFIDESTYALSFEEGLTCSGSGKKFAGQMKNLLATRLPFDEQEQVYEAYRDIIFEKDRSLFNKYDFRYDITVILPGEINGECKKTSGHYHGSISKQAFTYPEVYQVLEGVTAFVLQKVKDFEKPDQDSIVEDLKVAIVKAGESIIIPPFYGHCSINIGNGPLLFSNLAVVSCPLYYEPIQSRHGLSIYILKYEGHRAYMHNPAYTNNLNLVEVFPIENKDLGISFGKSIYTEFVKDPDQFAFLLNPEPYISDIMDMLD